MKGLDYGGGAGGRWRERRALRDWTGRTSARSRCGRTSRHAPIQLDVFLPAPGARAAIPGTWAARAHVDITREIIGRRGLGWMRRIMIFARP
jgi:hypothetical protein